MFFLSHELGPLWPKLDPSNYWALPLECSSFLSSLNLAVQHPYPFSKLISTLGVFILVALLSGLYCERRFINLEIRNDTNASGLAVIPSLPTSLYYHGNHNITAFPIPLPCNSLLQCCPTF